MAALLAKTPEGWPPICSQAFTGPATGLVVAQVRAGGGIFVEENIFAGPQTPVGNNIVVFNAMEDVWADAKTRSNVVKTVRALKLHMLKKKANTTGRFLSASVNSMSLVFTLKKFPSNKKALQIPLPHGSALPCEGLFVKTAKGKKVFFIQFGRGDMGEETLAKNAISVCSAVRETLDARLVREITVEVDGLALPVWNRKVWERGKQKLSARPPRRSDTKKSSMDPPASPPPKTARIT